MKRPKIYAYDWAAEVFGNFRECYRRGCMICEMLLKIDDDMAISLVRRNQQRWEIYKALVKRLQSFDDTCGQPPLTKHYIGFIREEKLSNYLTDARSKVLFGRKRWFLSQKSID